MAVRDKLNTARAMRPLLRLMKPEGRRDPYPAMRKIQSVAPLIYVPTFTYLVTRYEEAASILRDPRFSSDIETRRLNPKFDAAILDRIRERNSQGPRMRNSMLFRDGTDHERLRGLVSRAFTPRMIEGLRPRIEQVVDDLLDKIEADGSVDLVAAFAYPLPVTIICELLGVPVEDQHLFREWTALLARALDPSLDAKDNEDIVQAGERAAEAFGAYLGPLIERRRATPGPDLLTALIAASDGGDRLHEDELQATCLLLLVAGHETTTNLISSGMLALLQRPDQLALLRRNLDDPHVVRTAIEELLRFQPPVIAVQRIAKEDVRIGKTTIPAGYDAILVVIAANRDPRRFREPDTLDLMREDNGHLSFSGGPHFCLGAPLARLEGQIAITKLLRRFPQITLDTDEPEWRETITLRSLKTLPVTVSTTV